MPRHTFLRFLGAVTILGLTTTAAFGQKPPSEPLAASTPATPVQPVTSAQLDVSTTSSPHIKALRIDLMAVRGVKKTVMTAGNPGRNSRNNAGPRNIAPLALEGSATIATDSKSEPNLPLWTFTVRSSRDGNHYPGVMVGRNPFNDPGPSNVPTEIVPLIIKTQNIGVSFDSNTGVITTTAGATTFNPNRADDVCLSPPNDVPTRLVSGSPIFTPASFTFGGTFIGKTQYVDAFQRANFWNALGEDRNSYHVRLNPVRVLNPIVLNVPSVYGLAITNPLFFGPPAFCAPFGIVDIGWFDNYVNATLIPSLGSQGVNSSNLPIFLVYNVVWAEPVTNLFSCCALGYHSITGFPQLTQTYSPSEFDTTGVFGAPLDSEILSHEVAEWMDDPHTTNPTPLWGNTGQVQGGCQGNLEVGDPLTGTDVPSVTMPNGFTYHLQELAFFSWFFGAPSIGVNGWFSDNGTFTTDAGPPCF